MLNFKIAYTKLISDFSKHCSISCSNFKQQFNISVIIHLSTYLYKQHIIFLCIIYSLIPIWKTTTLSSIFIVFSNMSSVVGSHSPRNSFLIKRYNVAVLPTLLSPSNMILTLLDRFELEAPDEWDCDELMLGSVGNANLYVSIFGGIYWIVYFWIWIYYFEFSINER